MLSMPSHTHRWRSKVLGLWVLIGYKHREVIGATPGRDRDVENAKGSGNSPSLRLPPSRGAGAWQKRGRLTWQMETHRVNTGALVWPVVVAGAGSSGSGCEGGDVGTQDGGGGTRVLNSGSWAFPLVSFASSASVSER